MATRTETSLTVRHLFHQSVVTGGDFEAALYAEAAATQEPREDADCEARVFSDEQARATVELAERFVAAVEEMIGDGRPGRRRALATDPETSRARPSPRARRAASRPARAAWSTASACPLP